MALKRLDGFMEAKKPWYPSIRLVWECNHGYWWVFYVTVRCERSDDRDGSLLILVSSEESRILIQVWKHYQGRWKRVWFNKSLSSYMVMLSGLLAFTHRLFSCTVNCLKKYNNNLSFGLPYSSVLFAMIHVSFDTNTWKLKDGQLLYAGQMLFLEVR